MCTIYGLKINRRDEIRWVGSLNWLAIGYCVMNVVLAWNATIIVLLWSWLLWLLLLSIPILLWLFLTLELCRFVSWNENIKKREEKHLAARDSNRIERDENRCWLWRARYRWHIRCFGIKLAFLCPCGDVSEDVIFISQIYNANALVWNLYDVPRGTHAILFIFISRFVILLFVLISFFRCQNWIEFE